MLYHNGKILDSIEFFEKSYELDPSFEFAIQHLGWAYIDTDRYQKNLVLAKQSLSYYPNDPAYINGELSAYRLAGLFDEYFSKVREIQSSEVQLINTDIAFGDGYFYQGDYGKAKEKYLSVKDTPNNKVRSINKLIDIATTRGNLIEYKKLSDELLSLYTENDNQLYYVAHLVRRAITMHLTFDKQKDAKLIVKEIEKILNNKYNNLTFSDLGAVTKTFYLNLLKDLKEWDRADTYQKQSLAGFEILDTIDRARKYQQDENYIDAIKIYESLLSNLDRYSKYIIYYNLGICYMETGNFELAIESFDKMKNNFSSGVGSRKHFYSKYFLYSGIANLEIKNYRQAKSNIETFLKIWEPAPESLREKQMARDALKKINKAIS
tara:strand:- start:508 stop:1644 length:1137 start_codon:yes stop_codon:yes gene_type:complete